MLGGILIIDYGSQYTQLIARRIREFNVYCEIHPYNKVNQKLLKLLNPKGFILSGGPSSILNKGAPNIPKCINNISKPILGICYGLQLLTNIKGSDHTLPTSHLAAGTYIIQARSEDNVGIRKLIKN